MPRFSVWAIRLALLYFLAGITLGAVLLIQKAIPLHPGVWVLLPLHIDFLLIGWIVQLVFAVAYWIFPRFRSQPKRGNPRLARAALLLLNLSLLVHVAASLAGHAGGLLSARSMQAAAAVLLAASLWGRAKPAETGKSFAESSSGTLPT